MTKYILHGGATSKNLEDNKKFYEEIACDLKDNVTILCVYFAVEKSQWPNKLSEHQPKFLVGAKGKNLQFVIADESADKLIEQIKNADVIYLHGGETDKLIADLKPIKNFKELIKDKVVVGSSAGAYALSRYYYSNTHNAIFEGLGILPIKTICHYSPDKSGRLEKLKSYGENLETYDLAEGQFIVINE